MLYPYIIGGAITFVIMLIAVTTARWWMPLLGKLYNEVQESLSIGINRFKETQKKEEN